MQQFHTPQQQPHNFHLPSTHETHTQKPSAVKIILMVLFIVFTVAIVFGAIFAWNLKKNISSGNIDDVLKNPVVRTAIDRMLDDESQDLLPLVYEALGFTKEKKYLFLLLNNTELRPGGGFMGVYAVMKVNGTDIQFITVDGTENLDAAAPDTFKKTPPDPIRDYLFLENWYFRDSNWSPDFETSAKTALQFYREEGGIEGNNLDAVVAITPTVIEELLKIIGPVTAEGLTFTSENFTEQLQYEVEYEFVKKNIPVSERKEIIKHIISAILDKTKGDILVNMQKYVHMLDTMAEQKHVFVYALDADLQQRFDERGWTGETLYPEKVGLTDDYLLWVDANLGGLKTDHIMKRDLNYEIMVQPDGSYHARTTMRYQHQGGYDWRTGIYKTYARVFVPQGATLIQTTERRISNNETISVTNTDSGLEAGRTWFGTFIDVYPGTTSELVYEYRLPDSFTQSIRDNRYNLLIQKQLGTLAYGLTLSLKFGTNVTSAAPAENREDWGDAIYTYKTDLLIDRKFSVGL